MLDFLFKSKIDSKRKSLGLALSGGAARGIVHLGVIKALIENNIPISAISGVSSGSLIGGLFSAGLPIDQLIDEMKSMKWYKLAGFAFSKRGMASSKRLEQFVESLVGPVTLGDLKIPFSALTTDILEGVGVELKDPSMKLALAIRASASFPGVYAPVQINDHYYIDGGATCNIPVDEVRHLGANFVIAVDAIPNVKLDALPKNIARMVDRGVDLLLHKNAVSKYSDVDLLLKPIHESVSSFDLHRGDDLVHLGEQAIYDNLPYIKEQLGLS